MAYDKEVAAGNIRAERGRRNLSQRELAEQIGIPVATLRTYESATSGLGVGVAWEFADFFGMSLDEFVGRDFEKQAG